MAREEISVSELRLIAEKIRKSADRVLAQVDAADAAGLTDVLVHGAAVANTYAPYISDWSHKIAADLPSQIEAHEDGRKSRAQIDKDRYESRRAARKKHEKKPEK